MENFLINNTNKALWDANFINVDGADDVQCCGTDGCYKKAEPLNNDPSVQEFGAVTDILKYGYFNKDYKIFKTDSTEPICFISKEPLKIYDVVAIINIWEHFNTFAVFLGAIDNDTKYLFKYYLDDEIKNYKPDIKKSKVEN